MYKKACIYLLLVICLILCTNVKIMHQRNKIKEVQNFL